MYLEQLCNLDGVSGQEGAVRSFILERIRPFAEQIRVDSMGNLLAFKKGKRQDKTMMVSAHMDEVGFIISGITEKGFLRFKTVGGIDTRVIISKRVRIGNIRGVIGMKAIHLQKKEERESVPPVSSLFIDIGAKSKAEAEKLVSLGDYAAFDTVYKPLGEHKILAKALDDRIGCDVLMELMQEECAWDTWFCFLVQEEVGLRGAQIAAHRLKPDCALVLEGTTCSDVYQTEPHEQVTVCGGGAAVSFMDRSTIVPQWYKEQLLALAKEKNIPVQLKRTTMGGNDAGAIHKSTVGVPTASISVPCRYIHSPAGIADRRDVEAMHRLAAEFIRKGPEQA